MHWFDDQPPPRKLEAPPQKEAPPQLLDGTMRALLVLLAAAVAGYFLLPDGNSGQRQDIYGGIEPADVFGLRPKGEGDTEARGRLRLPDSVGNARVPDLSHPYRDPDDPAGWQGRHQKGAGDGVHYERYYQEGPRQFSRCPAEGCPPVRGMRPW
jgi:hypothetical protein